MLLYAQLFAVGLVALVNIYFGIMLGFYLTNFWWDWIAHFLGGMWAGFCGAWFFLHWGRRLTVLECALFALAIGLGWEVWEYSVGVGGSAVEFMPYWADTIKDLIMDAIGGAAAGLIAQYEYVWRR